MPDSLSPAELPSAGQAVLFVDDEPKVLQGLERMLRPLRHEWTMHFAGSGEEALRVLGQQRIDILVTDMRMPHMNGVELMQQVVDRHPAVIRMALSGHAERDVVIKAVHLAHQYLSKPCDGDLIKDKLGQAVRLRRLMACPRLQSMLASVTSLRTVPAIYAEITAELQSSNPSVARVAEIVARDPAITAKVLQLINSAYFGLRAYVSDPARAVQLLGLETVRALVLSTHVYGQFEQPGVTNPAELWQHSIRTARAAKTIARRLKLAEREANEAFAAGLLHDVGKLVLAETMPSYGDVTHAAVADGISLAEAERHVFGTTHAEVAAYLFGLWGLSYGIVEAIAWHHAPSEAGTLVPSPLTAVHAANVIDHTLAGHQGAASGVDAPYLAALGLADDFSGWSADVLTQMGQ
jgi:HD-like signal output (HDOD) protein